MTRSRRDVLGLLGIAAAGFALSVIALRFWILSPLAFFQYFGHPTEEEVVRQLWPIRLLQPEWFHGSAHVLDSWCIAESSARVLAVSLAWLIAAVVVYRHRRSDVAHQ